MLELDPVPALRARVAGELAADFPPGTPVRIARAPGRLDVMGGIADYTGATVCEMPLACAAAVALNRRADRDVQVMSFNLLDEHRPFTLRVPMDLLAGDTASLRAAFADPTRRWAGYLAGCLHVLHVAGKIDLTKIDRGFNLAVLSTVPLGAGVSSSAAIEVAAMTAIVAELALPGAPGTKPVLVRDCHTLDGLQLAALCQQVENNVVGAPCGIMDQVTSAMGRAGSLLRLKCQPHELLSPLVLPEGIRVVGINSHVKHSVGGGQYGRTRCAAFMGHAAILDMMRQAGKRQGRTLVADPLNGYLANLDLEDYKRLFRPYLPVNITGEKFLANYGPTHDSATQPEPGVDYAVQLATDHHVLEAHRVRNFIGFVEQAAMLPPASFERQTLLNKAGHLMYASHESYTNNAMLGADECSLLVAEVRKRESAGLYGAKITGGGSGGTVAVLCDQGLFADKALGEILAAYEKSTGTAATLISGSTDGAWWIGSAVVGA